MVAHCDREPPVWQPYRLSEREWTAQIRFTCRRCRQEDRPLPPLRCRLDECPSCDRADGWQLAQQRDGESGIRWQCRHCTQQVFSYRSLEP